MRPPRSSNPPLKIDEQEETLERLLVPPSPLKQLADWRAKMMARHSLPPSSARRPKKR